MPPAAWVGPRDEDGAPYLRPSALATLLSCPAKWARVYVDGQPDPSGPEARLGTCAHSGLQAAAEAFIAGNQASTRAIEHAVLERVERSFAEEGQLVNRLGEEVFDPEEFKTLACQLAFKACTWLSDRVSEGWHVLASEKVSRGDYDVEGVGRIRSKGHIDLVLADPYGLHFIVDLKTSSKAPISDGNGGYRQERKHTLQLGQYARNEGGIAGLIILTVAYRAKGVDTFTSMVPWNDALEAWVHQAFSHAARIVMRQDFTANPIGAGFLCAPKWCAFWDSCPSAQPGGGEA